MRDAERQLLGSLDIPVLLMLWAFHDLSAAPDVPGTGPVLSSSPLRAGVQEPRNAATDIYTWLIYTCFLLACSLLLADYIDGKA